MKLAPGARVASGRLDSPFHLDVDSLAFAPPGPTTMGAPLILPGRNHKRIPVASGPLFNILGAKVGPSSKG